MSIVLKFNPLDLVQDFMVEIYCLHRVSSSGVYPLSLRYPHEFAITASSRILMWGLKMGSLTTVQSGGWKLEGLLQGQLEGIPGSKYLENKKGDQETSL